MCRIEHEKKKADKKTVTLKDFQDVLTHKSEYIKNNEHSLLNLKQYLVLLHD